MSSYSEDEIEFTEHVDAVGRPNTSTLTTEALSLFSYRLDVALTKRKSGILNQFDDNLENLKEPPHQKKYVC